jgi:hypothetical protein
VTRLVHLCEAGKGVLHYAQDALDSSQSNAFVSHSSSSDLHCCDRDSVDELVHYFVKALLEPPDVRL